ncbi:MAG: TrkH family potassium uptake protein [Roseinatronobacter sp.]
MERRSQGTVVLVAMIAATALAMLAPAAVGFTLREHALARAFVYSSALLGGIAALVHLANRGTPQAGRGFSHPFVYLSAAYLILPALMAIPLTEAVPGLSFRHAWFEMISAFTTTGASLLDESVSRSVHLWRATVAWGGGLFLMVAVMALLAPLRLGGFELYGTDAGQAREVPGWASGRKALRVDEDYTDKSLYRMAQQIVLIAPVYFGVTLALWVGLSMAGNPPVIALILAMSTMSTSGIAPGGALGGMVAELLIAAGLLLALSRRFWPGARVIHQGQQTLRRDPELVLAAVLLVVLMAVLGLRAMVAPLEPALMARLGELWGVFFTSLSFLTTAGFVSEVGRSAEGVYFGAAGVVLLALALCGGGVATTAGGLKLMRAFALFWQARRELDKLVYPDSVGGDGPTLRGLRREGAHTAWLYLMIFIFSLTALTAALTLTGVSMEDAMIYATAALTTTGPVAQMTGPEPLSWAALSDAAKAILALGMVLGRLELLLLLSLVWRR